MPTFNRWVNPIYQKYLSNCRDRYVFLFGGAGSGKSIYSVQKFVIEYFLGMPNQKLLMSRKIANYIKASIWAEVQKLLTDLGLWSEMKVNSTTKTIEDPTTGNQIIMMGVDEPDKLKSLQGITKIYLEEGDAYSENDFLQLDLRMRGELPPGDFFQLWVSFNPGSTDHWLVKYAEPQFLKDLPNNIKDLKFLDPYRHVWRFATDDGEGNVLWTSVLNTTHKHNVKLDTAYKTRLNTLAAFDDTYSQVYKYGRWGVIQTGDSYISAFRDATHVDNVSLDPDHPIHYTTDFNTSPYMSGICCQLITDNNGEWLLNIFNEFTLKHPKNEAFYLGSDFVGIYSEHITKNGVYLYGDASGNNRLGIKDTRSLFADVLKGFGEYETLVDKRIPRQNPRYNRIAAGALGRRTFINAIFAGKIPVKITIDPSCSELIKDLRECKQDANGKMAKPKTNGVELRGHCLQALEYLICYPDALGYLAII